MEMDAHQKRQAEEDEIKKKEDMEKSQFIGENMYGALDQTAANQTIL